jgi:hypothetical protein
VDSINKERNIPKWVIHSGVDISAPGLVRPHMSRPSSDTDERRRIVFIYYALK